MTRVNGLRFLIRAKTTMPSIGAILDIENSEGEVYAIDIDECLAAIERGTYSVALRIETNLNLLAINVCLHAGTHVAAFGISSLLIAFAGLILHLCNLYRQCQLDR